MLCFEVSLLLANKARLPGLYTGRLRKRACVCGQPLQILHLAPAPGASGCDTEPTS